MKHLFILIFTLMSVIDIMMESSVKEYVLSNKKYFILAAVLFYMLQPLLFAYVLKYSSYGMAEANIFWDVFSIIIVTFIGVYYFKEPIKNIQILGILFTIIGIILIDYPSTKYYKKLNNKN